MPIKAGKAAFITVGLGELLWDLLPSGRQAGGAPANFAYISMLLGDRGIVASRVGVDALGSELQEKLRSLGLDTTFLQRDSEHATGTVQVKSGENHQPEYWITENVAWDYLEWTPMWHALAEKADAVCFGSLAQRSGKSLETIGQFLRAMRGDAVRIFDVNLRQQFYCAEVLESSMRVADIVKMNHEEVWRVMRLLNGPQRHEMQGNEMQVDEMQAAEWLRKKFGTRLVCITKGQNGSILVDETGCDAHPGFAAQIADTVGAGDAFTAGLVHHYLRGSSLKIMNEAANRMGAWVASHVGAMPPADAELLQRAQDAKDGYDSAL
jgi:fructokinase